MRVAGYLRVSAIGDRDPDRWLTTPFQRATIEGWCREHGAALVAVREDLDQSGGNERANLEALVRQVEAGALDGIVVAKLDRFSRNLAQGVRIIERIDNAGGIFVAAGDGFRIDTDEGRFQLHVMLSMADYELRRFKTGWRRARTSMVMERGQHWGATVPLGYQRGDDGRLVIDVDTAPLVKTLYERRAAGEGFSVLARWLADQGIVTGRGGIPGRRYVRELINRRVYLGVAHAGPIVNVTAHAPIVQESLWQAAQTVNGARPARSQVAPAALSGLLRCQGCRYVMAGSWSQSVSGKSRAYRCRKYHSTGQCPAPAFVLEKAVMPLVEDAFWSVISAMEASASEHNAAVETLKLTRERARSALEGFRDDPEAQETLGRGSWLAGLRSRQDALDNAEQTLARELGRQAGSLPPQRELKRDWPLIDADTRRRMYLAVFDAVVVTKPSVHRSHAEPIGGRVAFLRSGAGSELPKPGANPRELRAFDVGRPADAWLLPT